MRRKDKAITDPRKIEVILNAAQVINLGMLDGDRPNIVHLNFGYAENTIYFHGARQGEKNDPLHGLRRDSDIALRAPGGATAARPMNTWKWIRWHPPREFI